MILFAISTEYFHFCAEAMHSNQVLQLAEHKLIVLRCEDHIYIAEVAHILLIKYFT